MSTGHTQEVLGFLARWLLLALAAAGIAAATWAGALATAGVASDLRADLVMQDHVTRPIMAEGEAIWLAGVLADPLGRGVMHAGVVVAPDGPLRLLRARQRRCHWYLGQARQGTVPIVIRGLPHSTLAFTTRRVWVAGIAPDRRVFLVDARMAAETRGGLSARWRACAERMAARGEVALFHPGPLAAFVSCRRQLRREGLRLPVLFVPGRPGGVGVLQRARRYLGGRGRPAPVEVVTADADLARLAARGGFPTHLVGVEGTGPAGRLTCHASLASFRDSLRR